jgi:hypothetical protein
MRQSLKRPNDDSGLRAKVFEVVHSGRSVLTQPQRVTSMLRRLAPELPTGRIVSDPDVLEQYRRDKVLAMLCRPLTRELVS